MCTDQESFDIGVPSLINMENAVNAQPAHDPGADAGLRDEPGAPCTSNNPNPRRKTPSACASARCPCCASRVSCRV